MEEQENIPATNAELPQSSYLIPGAIIVAGVLIAGAVMYSNSGNAPVPSAKNEQAAVGQAVLDNLADDDPMLGDPNAPVTIVEFADFQCPFCRKFFETAEKEIIERYVKTGKARLIYRDFPLTSIHNMAQKSAEAAECADEQGKFWPYHDLLYQRQGELDINNLKVWARELGLNGQHFDACLDSGKYAEEVQKDFRDGD